MLNKNTIQEWRAVLDSKTWELKEIQQDVFRPLLLSYHDLTPAIKRCLLYCVIFPKDYEYEKNHLVELWMSQDYLNLKGSKEKEITGRNYCDELVMRSFFQDVEVNVWNGNIRCKIHDIVHDFLQYLTENECLILDHELDASERTEVPNDKIQHLTLTKASESESLVHFLLSYKKLRTLMVTDSSSNSVGPTIFELIVQLKSLRTLQCETSLIVIPETIGGLIHLRYLDLSGNGKLKELPSAMGSLYNLQTLRLLGCSLEKVDVRRLINLKHLYVAGCPAAGSIIGIEKLTHLQTLDRFFCGGWGAVNKLEHLKDLNQLQGELTISIEIAATLTENAAVMVNKAHLMQLIIYFPWFDEAKSREMLNGLEPHPALGSLSIREYRGDAFSHWLSSLHSLRVLHLYNCGECKVLPPLGKLASLESLEIERLSRVSNVSVDFLGICEGQTSSSSSIFISFPRLKQLSFKYMHLWEEWEEVEEENVKIMPCLSQLTIDGCSLKALPDFLWKTPQQKLEIYGCKIS